MTNLTFYGGVNEIGGNKILLEDKDARIFLDFGMSFGQANKFFSEFLRSIDQFDHKILASGINTYLKTKNKFLKPYPNVKLVLGKLKKRRFFLDCYGCAKN